MTDIATLSVNLRNAAINIRQQAVRDMLAKADTGTGFFSICPLIDILPAHNWPEHLQPAYEAMAAMHTINWAKMDELTRQSLVTLATEVANQLVAGLDEVYATQVIGG